MTWIIVTAAIVANGLSFTETHDYPTREACKADASRMLDLYIEDGTDIRSIYIECYRIDSEGK